MRGGSGRRPSSSRHAVYSRTTLGWRSASSASSASRSAKTTRARAARSIAPERSSTCVPKRSTTSRFTSSSFASSRWTISSLEATSAPRRANAFNASLFPAPIPPVIATAIGLLGGRLFVDRGLGLGLGLGLGFGFRGRFFLGSRRGLLREDVLREPEVRRGVDRLAAVGARLRHRAVLDALQREREPAPLRVDLEDEDVHGVALRDDLARVLDVVLRELRDVHQPLDTREDLDEGAERDDLRDAPLDDVPLAVALEHLLPRIGLRLLEAERDALPVAVDVEHADVHLLADLEHLGRVVHVAPRELGDVDQAVHAVEVDERTEVDDVRDHALDVLARLEPVEDRLPRLLALVLEDGAAREDDVVPRPVELDHLAAELLGEELVEVLDAADVDERGGEETAPPQGGG